MRNGLHAEVLVSLAVVMLAATGVIGVLLVRVHEAQLEPLRLLAARTLVEEAKAPLLSSVPGAPALRWWIADEAGRVQPEGGNVGEIPEAAFRLAEEARAANRALLAAGHPWQSTFFAAPIDGRRVAVASLPPAVEPVHLLPVLLGAVAVFTAFGFWLLSRHVVLPLHRLSAAARALADGELRARVPVDGVRETASVAAAFNDMGEALDARTSALEKAVADLRESNGELRDARAGLDRAERLAAVGSLAAGVAHEVGNPMGALLAFLDLAGRDEGLSETSRSHLDRAAREGQRVRHILRQLLDFSRPRPAEPRAVDLAALCEETAQLVRAQRRYAGIAITVDREGEPPLAFADPGRASQILLNLLLNAADAVSGEGSEIRVLVRPAAQRVRAGEDAEAAGARRRLDALECRVEDDGPGVAPEDRERIFDLFFTSKDPGEGTGLGLANAARAAEEMGGSLALDAEHTPGAAFVLRLPVASEEAGDDALRAPARPATR